VQYNAWQQAYRTGLDLNANGSLDPASTDRITETDSVFEKDGSGAWWTKATTKAYNQDNNATAVTTSISRSRLNKYTPSSSGSHVQSESRATDLFGNTTVRTVTIERGTSNSLALTTTTVDFPDSSVDEVAVTRNGVPQKRQSKEGLVYWTYYDSLGRPTKTTDPRTDTSTTARIGYYTSGTGQLGQVAWRQDAAGNQTNYSYDSATGYLATETDPLGKVARYGYTTRGERYRTWGDTSYPVEYGYDDYGQQVTMKTYRGGTGWTASTWPASPGTADTTTWAYDNATGTLTSKTDAASKTIAYTYNTRGQIKTRTWARTGPVTTTYNYSATTAEQTGIDYSDSTPDLAYTYNRLGQMASVTDITGTRTFNYSATTTVLNTEVLGATSGAFYGSRSITRKYASSGVVGRPTGYTIAGSATEQDITYGYDTYGRLSSVASGSLSYGYSYDSNSNLITAIADNGSWSQTRTYLSNRDLLDVIETKWSTTTKAKFDYSHDNLGRRTGVAKTGEMYSRYASSGLTTGWTYNDRSELTGEATSTTVSGSTVTLAGRTEGYAYDNIGNRNSTTHNSVSANYSTNSLNQYTQRDVPGHLDVTGFAPASATITVNSLTTGVTRQNDWYFKDLAVTNTSSLWQSVSASSSLGGSTSRNTFVAATPEAFSYDAEGNMTSDGRWTYTYDAENRLIEMQTKSALWPSIIPAADARWVRFSYDYLGRRVQKTVLRRNSGNTAWETQTDQKFIYDGWNLTGVRNASTLSIDQSFIWGIDWSGTLQGAGGVGGLLAVIDQTGSSAVTYSPLFDGNGNVMGLVKSSSGSLDATYEYDAFGQTLRESGTYAASNPFRFSTKYTDAEVGLVYYGLRYYSPSLGRFICRDPKEELGGVNLYAFCHNNGVNHWDFLGMDDAGFLGCGWGSMYDALKRDIAANLLSFAQDQENRKSLPGTTGTNRTPGKVDVVLPKLTVTVKRGDDFKSAITRAVYEKYGAGTIEDGPINTRDLYNQQFPAAESAGRTFAREFAKQGRGFGNRLTKEISSFVSGATNWGLDVVNAGAEIAYDGHVNEARWRPRSTLSTTPRPTAFGIFDRDALLATADAATLSLPRAGYSFAIEDYESAQDAFGNAALTLAGTRGGRPLDFSVPRSWSLRIRFGAAQVWDAFSDDFGMRVPEYPTIENVPTMPDTPPAITQTVDTRPQAGSGPPGPDR
jgi:RHS repeat-associated protein